MVVKAFWSLDEAEAERLATDGLAAAETRSKRSGTGRPLALRRLRIVGRQFTSPITLILVVAALIAVTTGDSVDGSIIVAIVVASGLLGAWQEGRADDAVSALLDRVAVTVRLVRGGEEREVGSHDVLPLDRLMLAAGDIVPADCLLLASDDLMVDESALTGESFPVDKRVGEPVAQDATPGERTNALFAGTHVISGTATALVVLTGADTTFGRIASSVRAPTPATSFEAGIRRFGLLLLRVMLLLVAATMIINLLLARPLIDSLLFALALAVGITPQMLPVVVSVSLAAGARRLARHEVIVKRLDVIEDLGALSVLCTDKTGTLTVGVVEVDRALDADGNDSDDVLRLAALNAGLQRGYPNALDQAVLARSPLPASAALLDELPYDFQRKRLSVLTDAGSGPVVITKGALDSVLACCDHVSTDGAIVPLAGALARITTAAAALGDRGYRVIGVADRPAASADPLTSADESGLVFRGILVFRDPVKPTAAASMAALERLGIGLRIVTGDSRHVTGSVASALGIDSRIVLGREIEAANPAELRHLVATSSVFAEVEPAHKIAIVRALRANRETVGFLGDGINDAGAIHAADVGISVEGGVDAAKDAAAIVLLGQDLAIVATGVELGRRTFANTLKYVRVASSANFGNILSMVIAAAVLPYLPMLPAQILLLNFLADVPNTLVSRDRVDASRLRTAGTWDMRGLTRFMVVFGAVSTVFDLTTFAILAWGFGADATLFHTGWFVESALTQFVAMMTLRTGLVAWRSRPDTVFLLVSAGIAAVTLLLPLTPLAGVLGFTPLPPLLLAAMVVVAACYGLANEVAKKVVSF